MLSWKDQMIKEAQNADRHLEAQKEQLLSRAARQARGSKMGARLKLGRTMLVVVISLVILATAFAVVGF